VRPRWSEFQERGTEKTAAGRLVVPAFLPQGIARANATIGEMQKMRKLILRLSLLLCLGASIIGATGRQTAGQTEEWKRYKNVDGNFSVLFPVEPTDTVNNAEGGVQSHTLLALVRPFAYSVVYTAMTKEQTVDEATFKAFQDGVLKELPKCSVPTVRAGSPAMQGYIGHWYRLNCDMENSKLTMVGNLYWGKHYAYAVMAMFLSASEPPTANKFTDSFSVIDASK
jgi:hypothetical protein